MRLGLLLLLIMFAPLAARADFEGGIRAYNSGDFEAALAAWEAEAARGNADADWLIGNMYLNGQGVDIVDAATAARHYMRAAGKGHGEAQVSLATLYRVGLGVPRDVHQAVALLYKAAFTGNPVAQVDIAELYLEGVPGEIEPAAGEALDWYALAARQNVAYAQVKLAQMYTQGIGVQGRDLVEGMAWLNAATRIATLPKEPKWSARIRPLDRAVETDAKRRTLRQIIFDLSDATSRQLSKLQLAEADRRFRELGLDPLE